MAPAVEMRAITKRFGSFVANDQIDLIVEKGEVHALLGENGAGKTTLMNSLYGVFEPSAGEIWLHGKKVRIPHSRAAIRSGIGMVHQHFMLVEPFTVTENIVLGQEISWGPFLDLKKARAKVLEYAERYGLAVNPDAKIQDITVGMQQRVEILKTLYRGAEILILDEPTAVLTPQEIVDLGKTIRRLTQEGKSVIIITHKLKEIKMMADRCTIIRRGKRIDTVNVADVAENSLAELMVGREVQFVLPKKERVAGDVVLEIDGLRVRDRRKVETVRGLNLEVHAGEILGVAGVDGNGQSELLEALTGLNRVHSGSVKFKGDDITNFSPRAILERGISIIPEDRQKKGLVLPYTVAENMGLKDYRHQPFSKYGLLNFQAFAQHAKKLIKAFDVRPDREDYRAGDLSGGNQQKVIIARELHGEPSLVIAAQPTRGLDVGAIEFVHRALIEQRDSGRAVLLISLELDEVLNLADRIAVIYEGKIVKVLQRSETDEKVLGILMAGGRLDEE